MVHDPDYLAVYGTLGPAFPNAFAHYLRQHSQYVGEGTFPGLLFDLGTYPGAIYQLRSTGCVWATVYAIAQHKQSLLAYLDEYEGIGKHYPAPTEYIRTVIPINVQNTQFDCWTYIYNLSIANKQIIPSGDYEHYATH